MANVDKLQGMRIKAWWEGS